MEDKNAWVEKVVRKNSDKARTGQGYGKGERKTKANQLTIDGN